MAVDNRRYSGVCGLALAAALALTGTSWAGEVIDITHSPTDTVFSDTTEYTVPGDGFFLFTVDVSAAPEPVSAAPDKASWDVHGDGMHLLSSDLAVPLPVANVASGYVGSKIVLPAVRAKWRDAARYASVRRSYGAGIRPAVAGRVPI